MAKVLCSCTQDRIICERKMESHQKQVETVRDRQISVTEKVSLEEVIIDPEQRVSGPGYTIGEADYLILTGKTPSGILNTSATGCLGVGVAYVIVIGAKCYEALVKKAGVEIDSWEITALVISLLLSIFLFLAACFLPSKKKKLLKKMREHLESQPKRIESRPKRKESYRRY